MQNKISPEICDEAAPDITCVDLSDMVKPILVFYDNPLDYKDFVARVYEAGIGDVPQATNTIIRAGTHEELLNKTILTPGTQWVRIPLDKHNPISLIEAWGLIKWSR